MRFGGENSRRLPIYYNNILRKSVKSNVFSTYFLNNFRSWIETPRLLRFNHKGRHPLCYTCVFAKDQDNPPSPQTMSLFRTRIAQSSATGWTESPAIGRSDTSATPVRRASTTKSVGSSVRLTASETGNTSNSKSTSFPKSTARNHYEFMSETVEEAKKRLRLFVKSGAGKFSFFS